MKMLGVVLAGIALVGLAAPARAQEKADKADNKKLIVGKWEAVKADEDTLPVGAVVEHTADGKLKVTVKEGGKEEVINGTYTVEGETVNLVFTLGGKEEKKKLSIKKLNETEYVASDEKDRSATFKRVK